VRVSQLLNTAESRRGNRGSSRGHPQLHHAAEVTLHRVRSLRERLGSAAAEAIDRSLWSLLSRCKTPVAQAVLIVT